MPVESNQQNSITRGYGIKVTKILRKTTSMIRSTEKNVILLYWYVGLPYLIG